MIETRERGLMNMSILNIQQIEDYRDHFLEEEHSM